MLSTPAVSQSPPHLTKCQYSSGKKKRSTETALQNFIDDVDKATYDQKSLLVYSRTSQKHLIP